MNSARVIEASRVLIHTLAREAGVLPPTATVDIAQHIYRERNGLADSLASRCIDEGKSILEWFPIDCAPSTCRTTGHTGRKIQICLYLEPTMVAI